LSGKNQDIAVKLLGRSDERGEALSGGDGELAGPRVSGARTEESQREGKKKWRARVCLGGGVGGLVGVGGRWRESWRRRASEARQRAASLHREVEDSLHFCEKPPVGGVGLVGLLLGYLGRGREIREGKKMGCA
jgi:hypothetical protein